MKRFFAIIVVSLSLLSCASEKGTDDNPAVAKIGSYILYKNDVTSNIPDNLTVEDSLITAEHYIKTWINEMLLYKVASENITNIDEIELMAEEYRRSLVVYSYQEKLVNEKMPRNVDEQSLRDFYEKNRDMFILDKPLLKGVLVKIPTKDKKISYVRYWCRSLKNSRKKLEDFCNKNTEVSSFFIDEWTDLDSFAGEGWVFTADSLKSAFKYKKYAENKKDGYSYILGIEDVLQQGSFAPYEYAKTAVAEMVLSRKKIEFLDKIKDELYERAVSRGQIELFNE
jgi:hypothetical protein